MRGRFSPKTAPTESPYMRTSIFTLRQRNGTQFAASLGQSARENPARWLTWLRRLRTANIERVEAVLFKAYRWRPRITNMRQAREAAGRVPYLNCNLRLLSVCVMNL